MSNFEDPFAGGDKLPSVTFKDATIGTSYQLKVTKAPELVQARDYETGNPAFWPDGGAKMTVVTTVVDLATGEEKNLWAAKPSAMFRAIGDAQKAAGAQIKVGDTLTVTFTGEKPNEKNPRLNPQKLYSVTLATGDAFADQPPTPTPAAPAAAAPAAAAPAAPPALAAVPQYTPEQIAAARAAGIPLPGIPAA